MATATRRLLPTLLRTLTGTPHAGTARGLATEKAVGAAAVVGSHTAKWMQRREARAGLDLELIPPAVDIALPDRVTHRPNLPELQPHLRSIEATAPTRSPPLPLVFAVHDELATTLHSAAWDELAHHAASSSWLRQSPRLRRVLRTPTTSACRSLQCCFQLVAESISQGACVPACEPMNAKINLCMCASCCGASCVQVRSGAESQLASCVRRKYSAAWSWANTNRIFQCSSSVGTWIVWTQARNLQWN